MNSRKNTFIIATAIFLFIVSALFAVSLYLDNGYFIYVLDDPYIHMAIARNFVTAGNWAVNGLSFSSSTSSPLWTLIISAADIVSGVNVFAPFILNILFSAAAVFVACKILNESGSFKYSLQVLVLFTLAVPLPALVFTGMEHIAQLFFALLFIRLGADTVNSKKVSALTGLVIAAIVLTALRYEDMFLIFSIAAVFALRKKYAASLIILAAGALPIIAYGLVSESNGWMFLPNPILIKSRVGELTAAGILKIPLRAVKKMLEPDILFLLPGIIFVFLKSYRIKPPQWNKKQIMFFAFLITYILHMFFAQTGWFFRYEAYLIGSGIIILWINLYDLLPEIKLIFAKRKFIAYTLAALMLASAAVRAGSSLLVPQASNNIYNQHYQMAMFVRTLPEETVIAANDIGILNYYTLNYIVDLWGLADIDAARLKLKREYNAAAIDSLTKLKNVQLAIVYKDWFDQYGGLPSSGWHKLGEWKMNQLNIVNGNETVSFYCLDSERTEFFRTKLAEYSKSLSEKVIFKP